MTTQSTTLELDGRPADAIGPADEDRAQRTYEIDAATFDQATEELADIAGSLAMLACITDQRGPLDGDGEHQAALFRLLHRDAHRCLQRLEATS